MADEPIHPEQQVSINSSVPHSARIWNYWLGGKDHYEADREAGERFQEAFPAIVDNARAFRAFLARGIHHLAAEAGVRQFLDVGTGLPTFDNTHQVAQRAAPTSRIVYVDNDPLVLVHAHALLTSHPDGVTDYVHADLRDPGSILEQAARTLDFDQPIALILSGILGHVADYDEAREVVGNLLKPLPSGSYVLICDGTATNAELQAAQDQHNDDGDVLYHLRTPEQMRGYFEGLELVEPGVVPCPSWRPDADTPTVEVDAYGGIGRKP